MRAVAILVNLAGGASVVKNANKSIVLLAKSQKVKTEMVDEKSILLLKKENKWT